MELNLKLLTVLMAITAAIVLFCVFFLHLSQTSVMIIAMITGVGAGKIYLSCLK